MVEGARDGSVQVSSQSKEVSSPKSYANVVGSRPSLTKFDFEVSVIDGKATVAVPDAVLDDSVPLWEDFLIGRFPSTAPHVAKIQVIVNKIWNLGDKNIKIDVYGVNDTTVKFRIRNASARLRALRRGMWNICEQPMIVSRWTPIVEDAQPEIKTMPLWVVVKNVPHSMFTWPGLSFLASPVGEPKRLHPDTELVANFEEAKFFVEVDLIKELPKTYFFQVRDVEVCVEYEYPWLPQRCGICKKWGHPDEGCLASLGKAASPKKVSNNLVVRPESQDAAMKGSKTVLDAEKAKDVTQERAANEMVLNLVSEQTATENGKAAGERTELPVSRAVEDLNQEKDGEWTKVTHSGGKSSKASPKKLVYGQVRIASPTRYDALRDSTEEGEFVPETNPSTVENSDTSLVSGKETDIEAPTMQK